MKKTIFNLVMSLALLLILIVANTQIVSARVPDVISSALPNPGTIIPIPPGKIATYSQGPHLSGFKMGYITNPGKYTSSIDLGYSGTVVAPLAGKVMIARSCADGQQIVFINAKRGSDGTGWSVGLVHIHVNSTLGIKDGVTVKQGQIIGYTVLPPKHDDGQFCGWGNGMHIHYTLMKWKMVTKGPVFTEQDIVNTYIGVWIVKNTYLQGPTHNVQLGQPIK
jgi:hypothetical protein